MDREITDAIDREREHQRRKHAGALRSVPAWLLIIEAELAEAKAAWVNSVSGDDPAALAELLQVAACCVGCLEQHGIYGRDSDHNRGGR